VSLDPPTKLGIVSPDVQNALALQHFSHVEYQGQQAPVWTLFYNSNISTEQLRLLRIHLWRLHNEREVLRLVLRACLQKQLDPSQPALRDYLACQSASLRRAKRHGLPQADLLSQAYALDTLVNASEISLLSQILRGVSPGIAKSVELASRNTSSAAPPRPAVYIDNDAIQAVTGPGMTERYVIPASKYLMALGPTGIVAYVAASALVHAPPAWPYFAFLGVLLVGAALYFMAQKPPEYGDQSRVVTSRKGGSRKVRTDYTHEIASPSSPVGPNSDTPLPDRETLC
jgi:hypothetical protein